MADSDEEVEKWINKADGDLRTAKYNLEGEMLDAAIFYSQQSAEKAFKALLIKKTSSFPWIHDLKKLAELVEAPDNIIELCSNVNPVYIISRYPNVDGEYSKEDAEEIIRFAEEVLEWIKEKLS
ncbi:MAG: HEPN domain-containing protein [Nanoarchaeota archaeon]|nr:HEPN domain-containing protein [Nanoarchaeota archaeon]